MSDEHEFGLVMPFVVCVSNGGPFDDNAFCAGWEMGKLDVLLSVALGNEVATTIRRDNLPQADLIAMNDGWTITEDAPPDGLTSVEADAYTEWACVTFKRVRP